MYLPETDRIVRALREKCGVFGIFDHQEAAQITYLGLYALQHRGQESAGIVVSDGKQLTGHRGMGLVPDVFQGKQLQTLKGRIGIGHVRYSTTGGSEIKNAQPFQVDYSRGSLAIAHNGNLVNTRELRSRLEQAGSIFQSTMDSEIIVHLIAKSKSTTFEEALIDSVQKLKGAYSLVLLTQTQMIGVRDPGGFRPLCLGKLNGSYVLASETCALDLIQAEYIREVDAGEIVIIDDSGLRSIKPFPPTRPSAFDLISTAHVSSLTGGKWWRSCVLLWLII